MRYGRGDFTWMVREILRTKAPVTFRNRERLGEYDFVLQGKRRKKGVSAMLRVKNEERKILYCLGSLTHVFDEVVLIDNGSTDSTLELVRRFKKDRDPQERISLFSYPFAVARCGKEHRGTPEDSVHSLVYYYNWCLSKCRHSYVFKIDADMIVLPEGTRRLRALFDRLSPLVPTVVEPPVQTIYRGPRGNWLLSTEEVSFEPRLFPNTSAIRYSKGKHWEVLRSVITTRKSRWTEILFYELKDTSEDEFLHWTDTNFPTDRKRLEWKNFNIVRSGDVPGGFIEIAPSFLTEFPSIQPAR